MGAFQKVYSDAQRDAIGHAWADLRIRPAQRIAAMAAAGELEIDGEILPAFHVPVATVRDLGRRLVKRRTGAMRTELAQLAPATQVEAMRARLVNAISWELDQIDREHERKKPVDGERIRKVARAAREVAAMPTHGERAALPAQQKREREGATGLASSIKRAAASGAAPLELGQPRAAEDAHDPTSTDRGNARAGAHAAADSDSERINAALGSDERARMADAPPELPAGPALELRRRA